MEGRWGVQTPEEKSKVDEPTPHSDVTSPQDVSLKIQARAWIDKSNRRHRVTREEPPK